jgi:hypothetical protein
MLVTPRFAAPAVAALIATTVPDAVAGRSQNREPCTPSPGLSVVMGMVRDAETSIPLQGAGVSVRWSPPDRPDRRVEKKGETLRTGFFRICDVPTGTLLVLQASFFGQVGDSRSSTLEGIDPATFVLRVEAPLSTVIGTVFDHESKRPVQAAAVRLGPVAAAQITQADGAFRFEKIPPGKYPVTVEHVAYRAVDDSIDVDLLSTVSASIRLAPNVIPVAALEVTVRSWTLERTGFYTRQERRTGHFLTRRQIENMQSTRGSDVLRAIAGIRIEQGRFGQVALGRGSCPFRFIMDGVRIGPGFSMDDVSPHAIEGIEIYMGAASIPIEFQGFASDRDGTCGVIVIWTRRRA